MKARIYKPAKSSMQSGRLDRGWILEYLPETRRSPEPLMGWISSGDTLNQVKLRFNNCEEAIVFAEKEGMDYELVQPHARKVVPQNYTDNFRILPMKSDKRD